MASFLGKGYSGYRKPVSLEKGARSVVGGPSEHSANMPIVSLTVLVLVTFFTTLYMKGLNSVIPLYYDSIGYSATVGGTFVGIFTALALIVVYRMKKRRDALAS